MPKEYLVSDMSEEEAHFITTGDLPFGEKNALTRIIQIIGKYYELKKNGKLEEIESYNPNDDNYFHNENQGYTYINSRLKEEINNAPSRKFIKHLSRKWCFSRIKISFQSGIVLEVINRIILQDPVLKKKCDQYKLQVGNHWSNYMPIQAEFLSTRFNDQHKDYLKAGEIINNLQYYLERI
jgi:hypothetical protein